VSEEVAQSIGITVIDRPMARIQVPNQDHLPSVLGAKRIEKAIDSTEAQNVIYLLARTNASHRSLRARLKSALYVILDGFSGSTRGQYTFTTMNEP
jgi:hypothetical protein